MHWQALHRASERSGEGIERTRACSRWPSGQSLRRLAGLAVLRGAMMYQAPHRTASPWRIAGSPAASRLATRITAKVRGVRVLPRLNDTAPDRAGAGEIVKQMIAVALPDGPLQSKQLFSETAQNL